MTAVTIDDSLVHYEALGRGRPVIVLHTWLGSWRYWIPCMQQLSVKYRLYALDLWGFGDTGRNARRYDFDSQVALLHNFMDKLGITKAALVGHGFGAAVCARCAAQHPDRVPRLMAVAPPLFRLPAPVAPPPVAEPVERAPAVIAPPAAPLVDPPLATESAPATAPTADAPAAAAAVEPPPATPAALLAGDAVREQIQVMLEEQARRLGEQRIEAPKPAPPRASPPAPPAPPVANPLRAHWATLDRDELLRRHVSPGADQDKLAVEAGKADLAALTQSVEAFAAVDTLRDLLALAMPAVAVYGREDTLLPAPDPALFANGAAAPFPALALDATRHFPMLEHPTLFARLLIDFLDSSDVRSLAVKETWERRVR